MRFEDVPNEPFPGRTIRGMVERLASTVQQIPGMNQESGALLDDVWSLAIDGLDIPKPPYEYTDLQKLRDDLQPRVLRLQDVARKLVNKKGDADVWRIATGLHHLTPNVAVETAFRLRPQG